MAGLVLRRADFTVAWVCALPVELAAAQEMLDEEHQDFTIDLDNPAPYTFGRVGEHNVVLANLPGGQMGTNSAAAVAGQMHTDFPALRFCLMVGIGGGVPSASADIRLGDVVVSQPTGNHGGVIQYDFGKAKPDKFERIGFLNAPPPILLTAVAKLQARHLRSKTNLSTHLSSLAARLPQFSRDNAGLDRLFRPEYKHIGNSCQECREEYLVERVPRDKSTVIIHHGTIASGNQVIRDGVTRDKLSSELGGVLCFEMEAAGLMNSFPCLVVRGICDYADSHKNKTWQPYAAATAAAYAKELLLSFGTPTLIEIVVSKTEQVTKGMLEVRRKQVLESLEFPQMHIRHMMIGPPCQGTGGWLKETKEYLAWWRGDHRFLWIKGKAGSGKSTLMKHSLEDLRHNSSSHPHTVAAFFYHATGHEMERSTLGLLHAILYQIFTQNKPLLEEFISASDGRFLKGQNLKWEVAELMEALRIASGLKSWDPTILLLDGLDEGSRDEIRQLLSFLEQLCPEDLQRPHTKLRICFSSRHYPNITLVDCPEVHVERFNSQDIETFTHQKLLHLSNTSGNRFLVQSVLNRADGVFLWVDLVTNAILMAEDDGETLDHKMETLEATPLELDGLYLQIFLRLTEPERVETFRLLKWVLFASRSLTPLELCFAVHFEGTGSYVTFESWRRSSNFIDKGSQTDLFIKSRSRGLVGIQTTNSSSKSNGQVVQFIHQTVPEFLLRKGLAILQPNIDLEYMPGVCHHQMALCCMRYLSQNDLIGCASMVLLIFAVGKSGKSFLESAIPRHAKVTAEKASMARKALLKSYNSRTYSRYTASDVRAAPALRGSAENELELATNLVFSELPLLKYTLEAFQHHIKYAEEFRISQTSILELFLRQGPRFLQVWYSFQDALYLPRIHYYHRANWDDFLQAAVALGLTSCIRELGIQLSNRTLAALPSSCDALKALFLAVHQGSSAAVRHLVACGADLNARSSTEDGGDCPLDIACQRRDAQMVRVLIQNRAKINMQNLFGYTPLHHAVKSGELSVVQILLEAGAKVNAPLFRTGETPLHFAVINDYLEIFKLLLANGADKFARDSNKNDCVALAIRHRSSTVFAFLHPKNPILPAGKWRLGNLRGDPDPINRAMTASPSPEKQAEMRWVRSTGFDLNMEIPREAMP